MLTFVFMIGFSLYLASYGFVALFKPEWLMKIRAFSARLEGKGNIKRDDLQETGQARKMMAILALLFGVAGIILSVMMLVVAMQAQSGVVSV